MNSLWPTIMLLRITSLTAVACLSMLSGCVTHPEVLAINDQLPPSAKKGYVDLIADGGGLVFDVAELDQNGNASLVAILTPGGAVLFDVYRKKGFSPTHRMRLACTPGSHRFTVPISAPYVKQGNDPFQVAVSEGMVTPVKIFVGESDQVWIKKTFQVVFEASTPFPVERSN